MVRVMSQRPRNWLAASCAGATLGNAGRRKIAASSFMRVVCHGIRAACELRCNIRMVPAPRQARPVLELPCTDVTRKPLSCRNPVRYSFLRNRPRLLP